MGRRATVGVRELKTRLGGYLQQVRQGRTYPAKPDYGIRGSSLKTVSRLGPQRTLAGGAREGADRISPSEGRTAVLRSWADDRIDSGRRWGIGRLADCQISRRTNAVRSISPLISTSCTPKYTTFCIPILWL